MLATQNPIESEGTYNLPEAQLDRFMFKLTADYPRPEEEAQILELHSRQVDLNERLERELIAAHDARGDRPHHPPERRASAWIRS